MMPKNVKCRYMSGTKTSKRLVTFPPHSAPNFFIKTILQYTRYNTEKNAQNTNLHLHLEARCQRVVIVFTGQLIYFLIFSSTEN